MATAAALSQPAHAQTLATNAPDVLERDRVLHQLGHAGDRVELQHRLRIELVAHGLRRRGRDRGIFAERLERLSFAYIQSIVSR